MQNVAKVWENMLNAEFAHDWAKLAFSTKLAFLGPHFFGGWDVGCLKKPILVQPSAVKKSLKLIEGLFRFEASLEVDSYWAWQAKFGNKQFQKKWGPGQKLATLIVDKQQN